jgi:L-aspartate oxidase
VRAAGGQPFLDARALGAELPQHFPTVFAACSAHGIDPLVQPIPVVAAAHYHMGGIAVDETGRTSVPGLYACGEVAATGVHGANRLASNSLLESVVYPERIAEDARGFLQRYPLLVETSEAEQRPLVTASPGEWRALRDEMYANAGVERDEARLRHALAAFAAIGAETESEELRDAATVASLVASSALARKETRGSHVRLDFPATASSERHRSFVEPAAQPA